MPYVTSWERRGIKKGIKKGLKRGKLEDKREVLTRQLERKFGLTPEELAFIGKVEDASKLDTALDAFVFAETKEEVLKLLE